MLYSVKKIIYIKLILILFICNTQSQTKTIDSLTSLIKVAKEDSNFVKHLNALVFEYIKTKPENYYAKALNNYDKSITVSKK